MEGELILLDFRFSPFAARARIALAEKGVQYKLLEEDILVQKSQFLIDSNPVHKKVPVLVHDGKPICESLIIVEYIDEVWAGSRPPLMPPREDPLRRANARFWADFVDKKVYEAGMNLWRCKGEAEREKAKEDYISNLKLLEGELGDAPFFGGDALGFVDVALVPFTNLFYTMQRLGGFSVESECPALAAWAERCKRRESVAKSVAEPVEVYEFVMALKKKYGV
ncbi:putative glutathione S-transferase parC [Acorus calamus]|uniref:Glutathione S-transferase n=1 Tax=Acorus calamus TaxID=4465 RepID=A0AAV9E3N9_ACOCL|nr:putative glutathione S-transferase parC [Acorus calamus]